MPSDEQEMAKGVRLAAVAAISAIITATAVIGAGQFWISRSVQTSPSEQPLLIQTAG
jgi:hypothetical protein